MPQTISPKGSMPTSGKLRLDGVTLIDTRDGKLIPEMSILMDQGRIVSITPTTQAVKNPFVSSMDAAGTFAIPGFNNMHMHVIDQENSSLVFAMMLADGVTGFRQMTAMPYIPAASVKAWRQVTDKFHKLPSVMRTTDREAYQRQLALTKLFDDVGVQMIRNMFVSILFTFLQSSLLLSAQTIQQAPGYYRAKLGSSALTALSDGTAPREIDPPPFLER